MRSSFQLDFIDAFKIRPLVKIDMIKNIAAFLISVFLIKIFLYIRNQ